MKSSLITENGRRNKTIGDQSSLISYSSNKSYASSERKTQVKVACKVLCEMREDESSKLAMKFTQLRIVLATQSLLHLLSKYKSTKIQTYFWILTNQFQQPYMDSNQSISFPIHDTFQDLQRHQVSNDSSKRLYQTLNKVHKQQLIYSLQQIKKRSKMLKGIHLLSKQFNHYSLKQKYIFVLNMVITQQKPIIKASVLDNNQPEDFQLSEEQSSNQSDIMTVKEQLAIKFASTTMLAALMQEKFLKHQFSFIFTILRVKNNHELQEQQEQENIESKSDIQQTIVQVNQCLLGAQQLQSILFIKLQNYFQQIKIQQQTHVRNLTLQTLVMEKESDNDNSNIMEDLYTQRNLIDDKQSEEEEEEVDISQLNQNEEFKKPCSLQNISDIDESTTDKQIPDIQEMSSKRSYIFQKNKPSDILKNAVKNYCNSQQERKSSFTSVQHLINQKEDKKIEVKKSNRYLYLLLVWIAILFILILK